MTEPLLDVQTIDAFYGPIQALRGVSLQINPGERIALVGANGAGKTTTLRTISGLLQPTNGSIWFDGKPIRGLKPNQVVQRGIAHLPEGRELFSGLTVEENLRAGFWSQRKKKEANFTAQRDRVMDLFPILRERAKQAAGTLSGGEQQMLGVARALMSNPRLLIVDELSLGLAPKIVAQLFEILREVNEAGCAIMIVEQFVHMALANTDRAYVLAKGAVVLEGRSAEMLADPKLIASYLGEEAAGAAEKPVPTKRPRKTTAKTAAKTRKR
ncbi:MAG: ABC transporter ATP-binding protein [Actinomycetota bacterium]|nr:ABC transporter ATP-binding protein [Actinomycetota bacterium]